jgi:pSer/pThr/pTyr-binding forkhead associated (FHA) protein
MLSVAGEILGIPAFMAPEQWGDHEVDHRADLFAVGVSYYLLLTGHPPFRGRTPADFSWKIQAGKFDPIETYVAEVPAGVRDLVTQLLERDRNQRPPDARTLLAELDRVMHGDYPNLPRLEPAGGSGDPVGLVGRGEYEVGSRPGVFLRLVHSSILPQHAQLERTLGGILLRESTRAGRVKVNGDLVEEIVLRDKDRVQFGDTPPFSFREGNAVPRATSRFATPASSGRFSTRSDVLTAERASPEVVPGLLAAALQEKAHPRLLLCCFEALDESVAQEGLEASRRALERLGHTPEETAQIRERARVASQERLWRTADSLFQTTRENLGRSLESWLGWWFEVRSTMPQQLRPPGPRAAGRLQINRDVEDGEDPFTHPLMNREEWILGRSDDCDIVVKERSVSRQHLLLLRLITRFGFLDLGSRFGTAIGGSRREVGVLNHGDVIAAGRSRALFEDVLREETLAQHPESGCLPVDGATFSAMVELGSPATVRSLVRLLDVPRLEELCLDAARAFAPEEEVRESIHSFLQRWASTAIQALPTITRRGDLGQHPAAWSAWLLEVEGRLPPQVEPFGWGPEEGLKGL